MKKLMSAIVAFAISASAVVSVFAADTFKDVNSKSYSWAYSAVEDMAERGIIKGYDDGTFRPGNSVSRMDAFALFARLIGSNSEVNADLLAQAKEKYADVLAKYNLSYVEGDVAFMLLRGLLAESELDTYFAGTKKTEPMPRHEAAILITKTMLGEQDAKNEVLVDMDYTDVSSIPKASKQYVYYVTQKGLMSGMGENTFSPNTDVLRGQIAVMLSNTAEAAKYTFESVTISGVDAKSQNIDIKDADGKTFRIGYDDDARFFKGAELISASQLKSGQKAVLTYVSDENGSKLAFADISEGSIDEIKSVIFKNYNPTGGKLTITVTNPADDSVETYNLSATANITADGKAINVNDLKAGDYITIGLSSDVVVDIDAMQKTTKFEAVIEKVGQIGGTITISSDNAEFDGITLSVSKDVAVYKNGDTSNFSALGRGDKVTITLEYGIITKINATSAKRTITGILKGYSVSDTSTITISHDGKEETFDIPANVEITLNGSKADLSDFKRGNTVTVTVESEVMKKITATSAASSSNDEQVVGTVVESGNNTIVVQTDDDITITVVCSTSTRIKAIPSLDDYSFKNIKTGDIITAYGSYGNTNIFFEAVGMIIKPVNK